MAKAGTIIDPICVNRGMSSYRSLARSLVVSIVVGCSTALAAQIPFTRNDTTFLERDTVGGYHAVFIASKKDKTWRAQICDFKLSAEGEAQMQRDLLELRSKLPAQSAPLGPLSIAKQWVPVYRFQGKYYLYLPSDMGGNYGVELRDGYMFERWMEGPWVSVLAADSTRTGSTCFQTRSLSDLEPGVPQGTRHVVIREINPKTHLAGWSSGMFKEDENLMVPVEYAHFFPVIVNYSRDRKWTEFDFDRAAGTPPKP